MLEDCLEEVVEVCGVQAQVVKEFPGGWGGWSFLCGL